MGILGVQRWPSVSLRQHKQPHLFTATQRRAMDLVVNIIEARDLAAKDKSGRFLSTLLTVVCARKCKWSWSDVHLNVIIHTCASAPGLTQL